MWYDFFKVFSYAFTPDALTKANHPHNGGGGYSSTENLPNLRDGDGLSTGMGGSVRLRDSSEMIDLTSNTTRLHRYKEYERLRGMAEIDSAMTVFADEACFAGETPIMTPHGSISLKEAAETKKERFLCYAYDFEARDYTLAWAYNARKTKRAATIKFTLDNGQSFICTPDHRILLKNGTWKEAGKLAYDDELMPFYRLQAKQDLTGLKHNQFPRIYTKNKGWIHERQFVDDWSKGKTSPELEVVNRYCRMIADGLNIRQIAKQTGNDFKTIKDRMAKAGFSNREIKWLSHKQDHRKIVGIQPWEEIDVYDVSVEKHHNFATDWGIAHNCQRDDDGRVFKITTANLEIKEELEWLFFHRSMLNMDQNKMWNIAKQLFIFGDYFFEIGIDVDDPKSGIIDLFDRPVDSMYRIETNRGRLVEFQQSNIGPDLAAVEKIDIRHASESDLEKSNAIRFAPSQIIHIKIGESRPTFDPYGISLLEAARGPAHQLRLMEDAMLVYRLTRAPERLVFYIDTHNMPPAKAEGFVERLKSQFRTKKVPGRGGGSGAGSIEEKWHAPSVVENYWLPIRHDSNTRIEPLPGAQNLGEIDDTVYFRNKLYVALNFPRNYFNNEDTQATRISLSAQDIKFARLIERLQSHIETALWEIADRHLKLLGYPEEAYEDMTIKMTAPSDWRELTRAEVLTNRITNATTLKSAGLYPDFDIYVDYLKIDEKETKKKLARLKLQKIEELKFQISAQNPDVLGIGLPSADSVEMGVEPTGPSPMLGSQPGMPPDVGMAPPPGGAPPPPPGGAPPGAPPMPPPMGMRKYMDKEGQPANQITSGAQLPDPTDDELRRFNLEIEDYDKEIDVEEIDRSEESL